MVNIRAALNRIWTEFRQVGIADDLAIIDRLAFLLLQRAEHGHLTKGYWTSSPLDRNLNLEIIRHLLDEAIAEVGSEAELFDRHILFRLPEMAAGGRYPTPRNIVNFVIRVADVQSTHSIADFSCGSGGFLAYRPTPKQLQNQDTYGIEISPDWARLAQVNLRLHNVNAIVQPINALQLLSPPSASAPTQPSVLDHVFPTPAKPNVAQFDRILLNPPFGAKLDAYQAAISLNQKVGSRSETIFCYLAVQHLAPEGKAAVLVPSGLLFSNSAGERKLREELVQNYTLEAVLSFPKDAFQPYSPLQTHLILFQNNQPAPDHLIWFLQAEQDGYPAGRSRDLTQSPNPAQSDLPILEKVLLGSNSNEFDHYIPNTETPQVGIRNIRNGNQVVAIVCCSLNADFSSIRIDPSPQEKGRKSKDYQSPYLIFELATEPPTRITKLWSEISDLQLTVTTSLSLPTQRSKAAAIALPQLPTQMPRLLGVAISAAQVEQQAFDLRPEQYIGKQQELNINEPPAEILSRIYEHQQILTQRIDGLFGRLEMPAIADLALPSPLIDVYPFGHLSQKQKEIWEKIQEETHKTADNGDIQYYFNIETINPDGNEEANNMIRSTLNLFEKMGLIVPVTLPDPNTGEFVNLYRCVAERDLWKFDAPSSNSEEKA